MSYVEERPWWPIQSPSNGRKKKANGQEESEVRSSLLIVDLTEGSFRIHSGKARGKEEECRTVHKLLVVSSF